MFLIENTGQVKLRLRFRVTLMPGMNEIDEDAWSLCRDDPITSCYLATGRVRVCKSPGKEKPCAGEVPQVLPVPTPAASPESGPVHQCEQKHTSSSVRMDATDARSFVKKCRRPDVLQRMLEAEPRVSIRTVIEKRLQQLE